MYVTCKNVAESKVQTEEVEEFNIHLCEGPESEASLQGTHARLDPATTLLFNVGTLNTERLNV